jgi:hypothetical protein
MSADAATMRTISLGGRNVEENICQFANEVRKARTGITYFRVRGVRYRGAIPEARTRWEAEKAESKIKQDVFEGRFGKVQTGTMKLKDFIDEIYMPWAKLNKKSWLNDHYNKVVLKEFFGNKQLREIQPLEIERFRARGWRLKPNMKRNGRQRLLIENSNCFLEFSIWRSLSVKPIVIHVSE